MDAGEVTRRVASYRAAIFWIARNDDTTFLDVTPLIGSVSVALVADLFGRTDEEVIADLRKEVSKLDR